MPQSNYDDCNDDYDDEQGLYASDVCPECGCTMPEWPEGPEWDWSKF